MGLFQVMQALARVPRMNKAKAWMLCVSLLLPVGFSWAMENNRELTIKAAYLFRLSLFVDWPKDKLDPSGTGSVRFCITGDQSSLTTIKHVLADKSINQHAIEIVSVNLQSDLPSCHLLYISRHTPAETQFLQAVANFPVLTIGDDAEFYRQGGMVLLFEKANRIHFAVNQGQLGRSGVTLRAQLLNLAEQYP